MIPDQDERERALDPSQSFIVEAPAGSGKTGLLIQRYMRLLSVVDRPESIVAMTFTRKAAAEIKQRVHDALRAAHDRSPVKDDYEQTVRELADAVLIRNSMLGWNLLSDTGRLQIQTIDSLCAMLTRQMPVISEFGGVGQVVEDARDLYHLAARRMLRDLAEGDDASKALFHRVSLHFDNDINSLEGQVSRMLSQRDQWRFLGRDQDDELIDAFCQLIGRAHDALREVFRQHSTVDFTEVTRAAIKALGTPDQPSELLYWLDYRIEHLLVDEFQDTSRAQYDLIDALTAQWSEGDGHTLFLVGDPMQSIYRFREAEVSLFLRCWEKEQLGSVRLNPVRLTTNFRSTPEIVEWTQAIFSPIMGEDDEAHGAVKLRPSRASRPKSKIAPQFIPFIGDAGQEEANEIVRVIERAKDKSKVAILVRSRAHIVAILPALRKVEIRYEAVEIDELKEQQHILDLISLTRAVLHAGDRVAWLACLRAPWCGLTLADLSALGENESRTIPDLLSDPAKIAQLSSDGRDRAVRVQEILSAGVASVGRLPLRDLVENTWMALGGPAILCEANQHEDVDVYLNLIESFEEGGIIRDFSLLNQRLECLYAKPSSGEDCVQVLTIHKAKGLEFDTVILPKLASPVRSRENELLIWTETIDENGKSTLHVAAQPQKGGKESAYEFVNEEIKQKESHELKRLFYVAATRAKNELYLLGNAESNKDGTQCKKARSNTFLGLIWSRVEEQFQSELRRKRFVQADLDFGATAGTVLRRLPVSWRAPVLDAPVQWRPEFHRATASARKVTYEWVSDTSRHIGTVVHGLLRRVAGEGIDSWTPQRLTSIEPLIKSELLRLGLASPEAPKASRQVIQVLENILGSERGRWILQPHSEARSEWAIGGRIQDTLVSGTVDRVFRDQEGRLWIIDFKISEHKGGNREFFLDEEQRRYQPQLNNYATLLSRLADGPIWLGLYFPLLDGWREWQFEEEAALTA